ncbi:MAG: hypothetical protein J0H12_01045 [Candidatus Paracaedimonas acanthamoebae]|uniref:Usg family protein n=1 Tax=Candidatus Paracaedimonas acanthamoebae TaxID=244581 RepID=A0A8J7PZI9_9PROT|nr:hypothetical protein [Candidatus Paracaedimonas acanthamoebae]
MSHLSLQLQNYRLTTAEILYYLPDHPEILQTFIWQEYDLLPNFPELHKFLDFWAHHIEGRMHSVTVAHVALIKASEFKYTSCSLSLH